MFGFINVYKPKGITSHDVVARLRRITKIKQIGHTGTLDPFAEGVLPICIGKATRLIEYLSDDKAYIATIQFGKTTDTYDIEGQITSESDKKVTQEEVIDNLKSFEGEIEQLPPIYSAIKVNGKKLYEYAREGKEVEIKPREVNIYNIRLENFDYETQVAKIYIKCSKGTYIRTIGYDLGQNLGCGAYLTNLIRVQAGDFVVDNSVKLDDLTKEDVEKNLIYPFEQLPQQKLELSEKDAERISHGLEICATEKLNEGIVILTLKGQLVAVAEVNKNKIKAKKVFYGN